jgi:2'-5' RNA ligase
MIGRDKRDARNEKIRCFIAIDFPDEILKEVARIQEELEKIKFNGKIVELENLHLTLKFMGEVDDLKLEKIKNKLNEIKFKPFEVKLGEIGVFNIRGRPNIVWIKLEGKEIWDLQKQIDGKMREIGFEMEERFMSHITIARIKYVSDKNNFVERVKNIGVKGIAFKIDKFRLIKSELRMMGPVYTAIEEFKGE